jgi:hypothetical protein
VPDLEHRHAGDVRRIAVHVLAVAATPRLTSPAAIAAQHTLTLEQVRQLGDNGPINHRQKVRIGVQAAATADEKGELRACFAVGNPHAAAPRGVLGE